MMNLCKSAVLFLCGAASVCANRNAVGQTPIMGWSGYNAFMQHSGHCDKAGAGGYNETTFVQTMEALVSTGLDKLGYVYLNADDCWIAENRTADGKLTHDLSRFPHGMPWLIDQAHTRKLKLGLYAAASLETCRQYPGSQGYEAVDAATFAAWGADFAKLDSCGGVLANGTESWYNQYGTWSDVMNKSGNQMVFSCSWAVYFTQCAAKWRPDQWVEQCGKLPWEDHYTADKCHMWRYGTDLEPYWGVADGGSNQNGYGAGGVGDIIQFAGSIWAGMWRDIIGPGAFNDPDFLVVGCPLDRPCEGFSQKGEMPLTAVEQQTQFSMWCVLAAPLIIGSDIRHIEAAALKVLSNTDAIAINQDPLAAVPRLVVKDASKPHGGVHVWSRQMHNGDVAVAMVNMEHAAGKGTLTISDIVCAGCSRAGSGFDVWTGKKMQYSDSITLAIPSHETVLLRLTPNSNSIAGAEGEDL